MAEEGGYIEIKRCGVWVRSSTNLIKDGDEFRIVGAVKTRIADGDAYINERGNWSVRIRRQQ